MSADFAGRARRLLAELDGLPESASEAERVAVVAHAMVRAAASLGAATAADVVSVGRLADGSWSARVRGEGAAPSAVVLVSPALLASLVGVPSPLAHALHSEVLRVAGPGAARAVREFFAALRRAQAPRGGAEESG